MGDYKTSNCRLLANSRGLFERYCREIGNCSKRRRGRYRIEKMAVNCCRFRQNFLSLLYFYPNFRDYLFRPASMGGKKLSRQRHANKSITLYENKMNIFDKLVSLILYDI